MSSILAIINNKNLPKFIILLLAFIITGAIIWMRPYWGLMDDITYVENMIPKMQEVGIFTLAWQYGVGDLSWGMFRPTLPLMAYFVYLPGMIIAPWVTFLWNALLVFALIGFYCRVLGKILNLPATLLVLVCASFFYTHDLLQHPSLQEKLLLLVAAPLIYLCWNRSKFSTAMFWILALLLLLLGASVKASFTVHYSAAFLAFLGAQAEALKAKNFRSWAEMIIFGCLGIIMVCFFAYISKHGSYTQQYSHSKIIPNLFSVHGVLFLVPIFFGFINLAFHWKNVWKRPELLIPTLGVLAFLMIFLPWGIQGYIHTVVAPLYAALIIQIAWATQNYFSKNLWIVPLCIISVLVTSYRAYSMFGRLQDIGKISDRASELANRGITDIEMPCEEGHQAMERFFRRKGENRIKFHMLSDTKNLNGKVILRDSSMCPLPGRSALPSTCTEEILVPGKWSRSYQVSRVSCN